MMFRARSSIETPPKLLMYAHGFHSGLRPPCTCAMTLAPLDVTTAKEPV